LISTGCSAAADARLWHVSSIMPFLSAHSRIAVGNLPREAHGGGSGDTEQQIKAMTEQSVRRVVKYDQYFKAGNRILAMPKFPASNNDESFAMKPHETNHRATTPVTNALRFAVWFVILVLLILATLRQPARAQQPDRVSTANTAPLTAEQVVYNLAQMNLHRVQALRAYQGTRTYRIEYQGFSGARSAEMVVKLKYLWPGKKEFVILSATGSKLIIDKVLKNLLEAEQEELAPEIQRRSALTEANYHFRLTGHESGPSAGTYVLQVEPRRKDKFLYRGRIWVDASDFAVVRLEAEPTKNPSFWTRKANIVQVYTKVSDFWLPAHNHSITAIRLGGHADLTIEYKDYEITDASKVSTLATPRSTLHRETTRAQK
jgi:hypothetical protein